MNINFKTKNMKNQIDYNQKAKEKIRAYKSYSLDVKKRVIKQLDNFEIKNEEQYLEIAKEIPSAMRESKKKLSQIKKLKKQVLGLEKHEYAPEMNKLVLKNNEKISAPQCKTIDQALEICA